MTDHLTHGDAWALYRGPWQDWLAEAPDCLRWSALITDPPYSERTHGGQHYEAPEKATRELGYAAWTDPAADLATLLQRTDGWSVVINDHTTWPTLAQACEAADRYVFHPLPLVSHGGRIRLAGDGPSSQSVWLCVARPRCAPFSKWGTLTGYYLERGSVKGAPIVGCKQLDTMRKIIRDYTRPGDTVCDPFAGTGTTLLAAVMEGRRALGAEMNADTHAYAVERLRRWDAQPRLPGVAL